MSTTSTSWVAFFRQFFTDCFGFNGMSTKQSETFTQSTNIEQNSQRYQDDEQLKQYENLPESICIRYLAKKCLHLPSPLTKEEQKHQHAEDYICLNCFLLYIGDRLVNRHLFYYLALQVPTKSPRKKYKSEYNYSQLFDMNQSTTATPTQMPMYIKTSSLILFAHRIVEWNEITNNLEFIAQLFHIVISTRMYATPIVKDKPTVLPNKTIVNETQSKKNEDEEHDFNELRKEYPDDEMFSTDNRRNTEVEVANIILRKDPLRVTDNNLDKVVIEETLVYELIQDAYYYTALQANIQTKLSNESEEFLHKFFVYLRQSNREQDSKTYLKLIKRIAPHLFVGVHRWMKTHLTKYQKTISSESTLLTNFFSNTTTTDVSLPAVIQEPVNQKHLIPSSIDLVEEFDHHLPFTFIWYIVIWLTSNKIFPNANNDDPTDVFSQCCKQQLMRKLYDSDEDGYSIVTLCRHVTNNNGPLLFMFHCDDQRTFSILLEGELLDSNKPYGGPRSQVLQILPNFFIIERGPNCLYWNVHIKTSQLAIRVGQHSFDPRITIDTSLQRMTHPS
ncbi:unnamed protein product, partial [Didymodactylos carnosus]